jgi:hypothetical protein
MRGNLWSRAPAYLARPDRGVCAWPEAQDRRRRAGRSDFLGGSGAGCRCAGGAQRRHRRKTSSGPKVPGLTEGTVKVPDGVEEHGVVSRNSRGWRPRCGAPRVLAGCRRCPRARHATRASPGCCSGRAAASRLPATAGAKRCRRVRRAGVARTASAIHTRHTALRGPTRHAGPASAGRPARAADPRGRPVRCGEARGPRSPSHPSVRKYGDLRHVRYNPGDAGPDRTACATAPTLRDEVPGAVRPERTPIGHGPRFRRR